MLRFASLADLEHDANRIMTDVHHVVDAAGNLMFRDKSEAILFLRDEGFMVVEDDKPATITVTNSSRQEANIHLKFVEDGCMLAGYDDRLADQTVRIDNYDLVYTGVLPDADDPPSVLDDLYATFNLNQPDDFEGHSLSISDVVVLVQGEHIASYYIDSASYQQIPDFVPDYLRNAEIAMEDDLNMIDGIINNGRKDDRIIKSPAEIQTQHLPKQPAHRHGDTPDR